MTLQVKRICLFLQISFIEDLKEVKKNSRLLRVLNFESCSLYKSI